MSEIPWRCTSVGAFLIASAVVNAAPATCDAPAVIEGGQTNVPVLAGDIPGLLRALKEATPGSVIELSSGTYELASGQALVISTPDLVLTSRSRNRSDVIIAGGYKNVVIEAERVKVQHLTLRDAKTHAVQIRGERGATDAVVHDVHALDSGQQLVKVSTGDGASGMFADRGTVSCSLLEYTTHAPSNYTNGIDVLAGNDWLIRDNLVRRIRSESGPAGPAILVWKNASGTRVERNVIVDSWRGISLGLMAANKRSRGGAEVATDHRTGLIANNVVLAIGERGDGAIEASYAADTRVVNNTVYYNPSIPHAVSWSIAFRFASTSGKAVNNLANRPIIIRSPRPGAPIAMAANLTRAQEDWFVDIEAENYHLRPTAVAVGAGVATADIGTDIDNEPRAIGSAADVGADEYQGGVSPDQ